MKFVNIFDTANTLGGPESVINDGKGGAQYAPSSFPYLGKLLLKELVGMPFYGRVAKILSLYFDEIDEKTLQAVAKKAYEDFDDEGLVLLKVEDGPYLAKLYGGPSGDFKDYSSAIFPYLFEECKKLTGDGRRTLAVTAETAEGTTALCEAFSKAKGDMLGFYPLEGGDEISWVSMVTGRYGGATPVGVKTSIDRLSRGVRHAVDAADLSDVFVTRARGVNVGRIIPLTACFVSAYCDLIEAEEIEEGAQIDFALPAGDCTLALACYYAYRMGLPVNCILLACNANNAVSDFFSTGELSSDRELFRTMSSQLDVLVPEALAPLVFEVVGRDGKLLKELYDELLSKGSFSVEPDEDVFGVIQAGWADEDETAETIANSYDLDDCILDPNTAVAMSVYNEYALETEDDSPTVVAFIATPYLYANSVLECIGEKKAKDGARAIRKLGDLTAAECPERFENMYDGEVTYGEKIELDEVQKRLEERLGTLQ